MRNGESGPGLPRYTFLLLLACGAPPADGAAQLSASGATADEKMLLERMASSGTPTTEFALDGPVDPSVYTVGPSDEITLNLWTSPPVQYGMHVTPEGTLIIPTVAEIPVSGLTLEEVKAKAIEAVRRKFLSVQVTVTLTKPRPVLVAVRGDVLREGTYELRSTDRIDRAIEAANAILAPDDEPKLDRIRMDMSTRYVVLQRQDLSQRRVDFESFRATRKSEWNPYLREGDVIIVPRKNPTRNMVAIYGEVNLAGRYEFVDGDRLSDLLGFAHGLTEHARSDSAELTRLSDDGRTKIAAYYDVGSSGVDVSSISLQAGDALVVRPRSDLREDFRVYIEGEVLFPGTYPITKDRTRLSEIVALAGGFTESASLQTAELSRSSIHPDMVETERMLSLRGGISRLDSLDYVLETNLRLKKEIVNVDFSKLFVEGDTLHDVIMKNHDVIRIPARTGTIYVFGQVATPGHIPYLPGQGPAYYVRSAGGYTGVARSDDVRIIKARTKQWLAENETVVEEGDYIWIPRERETTLGETMATAGQAAAVLSVVVGMTAVIISLSN